MQRTVAVYVKSSSFLTVKCYQNGGPLMRKKFKSSCVSSTLQISKTFLIRENVLSVNG